MDCRGHLVDMAQFTKEEEIVFLNAGYEPPPERYRTIAGLELMGKKATFVGMNASGTLSKHARNLRKKRNQQAKASRRKNRCHQQ